MILKKFLTLKGQKWPAKKFRPFPFGFLFTWKIGLSCFLNHLELLHLLSSHSNNKTNSPPNGSQVIFITISVTRNTRIIRFILFHSGRFAVHWKRVIYFGINLYNFFSFTWFASLEGARETVESVGKLEILEFFFRKFALIQLSFLQHERFDIQQQLNNCTAWVQEVGSYEE